MAVRTCQKCGCKLEHGAKFCTNCGCEVPASNEPSVAIIYGIKQKFLFLATMKLYIDGQFVAKVKKNQKVEIPITKNCTLTAGYGINPFKEEKYLYAGETTKIQIVYDRILGTFDLKEIE